MNQNTTEYLIKFIDAVEALTAGVVHGSWPRHSFRNSHGL